MKRKKLDHTPDKLKPYLKNLKPYCPNIPKFKAIKAFEKYLFDYVGDYTDKDVERFKRLLDEQI